MSNHSLKNFLTSSIVQKTLTAVTGIALVGFVILHLAGNLAFLSPDPNTINKYSAKLHEMGPLLEIAEIGLYAFFGFHILNGILLTITNRRARGVGYKKWKSKGTPSLANSSSLYMSISGLVLLVFVVIHLKQFQFGPGMAEGYVANVDGKDVRDLNRLGRELFSSPLLVGFYVLSMLLLGLHLRHGFWSAFQSLGLSCARSQKVLRAAGVLLAVVLAVGFLVIPIWIHLKGGAA